MCMWSVPPPLSLVTTMPQSEIYSVHPGREGAPDSPVTEAVCKESRKRCHCHQGAITFHVIFFLRARDYAGTGFASLCQAAQTTNLCIEGNFSKRNQQLMVFSKAFGKSPTDAAKVRRNGAADLRCVGGRKRKTNRRTNAERGNGVFEWRAN